MMMTLLIAAREKFVILSCHPLNIANEYEIRERPNQGSTSYKDERPSEILTANKKSDCNWNDDGG